MVAARQRRPLEWALDLAVEKNENADYSAKQYEMAMYSARKYLFYPACYAVADRGGQQSSK